MFRRLLNVIKGVKPSNDSNITNRNIPLTFQYRQGKLMFELCINYISCINNMYHILTLSICIIYIM